MQVEVLRAAPLPGFECSA